MKITITCVILTMLRSKDGCWGAFFFDDEVVDTSRPAITCSNLSIETLAQDVKYVKS